MYYSAELLIPHVDPFDGSAEYYMDNADCNNIRKNNRTNAYQLKLSGRWVSVPKTLEATLGAFLSRTQECQRIWVGWKSHQPLIITDITC